jgi:hypothetical protein
MGHSYQVRCIKRRWFFALKSAKLKAMQVFLKKHASGPAIHSLKVSWTRLERKVIVEFQVQKRDSSAWLANDAMTKDFTKNWGLWNHDVVEAFLQLRKTPEDKAAPYLEIQVSPLNQPFALIITEPRKSYHAPVGLKFVTNSQVEERIWKGSFEVELPAELQGAQLWGGFFACLTQNPREYYALGPNPETNPDFHRPELFVKLDE